MTLARSIRRRSVRSKKSQHRSHDGAVKTAKCNTGRFSTSPQCPSCGPPRLKSKLDAYDEIELMYRDTCESAVETSDGAAPHGPQLSHWTCESCSRCLTLEFCLVSADARWVDAPLRPVVRSDLDVIEKRA